MANVTMAQVAPYMVAFKAKFNEDCTLTLDAIELALEEAKDDAELIQMLFDAQHAEDDDAPTADADETGTDPDRSAPIEVKSGTGWFYATKLDDAAFQEHLAVNAEAALENKRGAAVIGLDLIRIYTREVISGEWPIIGSTDKTHPGGNRQTHKYPTIVKDTATGEDKPGTGDWYADLFDGSPDGKAWKVKSDSLNAVKKGEKGKHVLPEHASLEGDEVALIAERSYLDNQRTTKKNAIIRSVNLIQKMDRINEETEAKCVLVTKEDGTPARSNKLVYIKNTKDETKFRVLTIGQALGLDIDKAKASQFGATYLALIGTKQRKPKTPEGGAQNIKVETLPQYDDWAASGATFFDRLVSDAKATNQFLTHLNSAGTDDLILSMDAIQMGIDGYLSKPGISKRLAELKAEGRTAKKKAA